MLARSLRHLVVPKLYATTGRQLSGSASSWPTVGIVGVGQLGAAVCLNLLKRNVPTHLFDLAGDNNIPDELKSDPILEKAVWRESARELAGGVDVVITALPKPEHVSKAFDGDDGILAGLQPGTTWIEHSTTDFENTLAIKEKVEAKRCKTIEAPLTGGMQLLREGKMVALVGADPEALEGTMESLIAMSAPRIVKCGKFGTATIIKIHSNVLCAFHDAAAGELLAVAKKAGIDMKLYWDAMRVSSGNSFFWETEVPLVLRGEYDPNFTAEMMAKDIQLGRDLGRRFGLSQPFVEKTFETYAEAIDKYGGNEGSAVTVKLCEDRAGVNLSEGKTKEQFQNWSYTSELRNGSYIIEHDGIDNPYRDPNFVKKP